MTADPASQPENQGENVPEQEVLLDEDSLLEKIDQHNVPEQEVLLDEDSLLEKIDQHKTI
jgi:hypothetical protein